MLSIFTMTWAKKLIPYAVAVACGMAVVLFVDYRAYHRGWDAASAAQLAAAAGEAVRSADANKRAIHDAILTIERLTAEKEQRDAQIQELLDEGAADPTAGNIAFPPASVRRLNSVD